MDKEKLKVSRKKIDQLDKKIFNLIKKRTKVVKHMLGLKKFKSQIVDHKRIREILKNIKKRPLLNEENLEGVINKIYSERKKIYNESDYKIICDSLGTEEIVKKIVKLYENSSNQI